VTDAEITKLCAKAMGLREIPYRAGQPHAPHPESALRMAEGRKATHWYDPLHDDSQMAALVKKLFIEILVDGPAGRSEDWTWTARIGGYNELPISISHGHDLNRAVCVCVARLAKEKK